jgi:hypothetical protein
MLNQLIRTIFSAIGRIALLLAGLVFVASLLVAASLLLALWLARSLWARLTGQPVIPWTFQVNRQAVWNRFYRAPGQRTATRPDDSNVIDVEPREIKPPEH